jgi:hypothetical protein
MKLKQAVVGPTPSGGAFWGEKSDSLNADIVGSNPA